MRRLHLFLMMLGGVIILSNPLHAQTQKTIRGVITDAETGETLPSATISIEGTYTGTISNADGEYTLTIKSLPATIRVRFIGYETMLLDITASSDELQNIELNPSRLELGEVVVTGEDPAISIMREVIERKQIWRAKIETYKSEAYTRQNLSNDTSIVSISESISEAFWDHEKGHREVLKSRRQTANIDGSDNFAGVSYLPNFYDDNIEIAGFDMVGVTSPKAFSFYTFKLVDYKSIDDKVVYEISVRPRRKLQPTFEGTIYVLDEDFAMLSVILKPNRVVNFPPPISDFSLDYEQQFNNFGGEFWLPVDIRIHGLIKIGIIGLRFPPIGFDQISRVSNYEVNVPLPDSLYRYAINDSDDVRFFVDSTAIDSDSLFVNSVDVVPLSLKEEVAYETLDSTATLEEAFKPKGFLARFIDTDDDEDEGYTISSEGGSSSGGGGSGSSGGQRKKESELWRAIKRGTSPDARFNRVDLLYTGLNYSIRTADRRVRFQASGGYSFGYDEASYSGKVSWWPAKKTRRFVLAGEYKAGTDTRYKSNLFESGLLSLRPLFGGRDYYDYYRNEGFSLYAAYRLRRRDLTFRTAFTSEEHRSINFFSSYDISGGSRLQRPNPEIDEGFVRAVTFKVESLDGNEKSFGVVGSKSFTLSAEIADGALGSDFSYTKYDLDLYHRFNTFYKRRLFPNTLDFRILAGTSTGDLPFQRYGILDASPGMFGPFGAFKTRRGVPFEGEHYAGINIEHNFRTIPFEILGLNFITDQGIGIIAFGGFGRTWVSDSAEQRFNQLNPGNVLFQTGDETHAELGLSLNSVFSIARIDFAKRLNDNGFFVGFSVARWF